MHCGEYQIGTNILCLFFWNHKERDNTCHLSSKNATWPFSGDKINKGLGRNAYRKLTCKKKVIDFEDRFKKGHDFIAMS